MDKFTRKELKTDHFAKAVGHTLEELGHRRQQVTRYALIGAVVVVLIIAAVGFFRYRAAEREAALHAMFRVLETPVEELDQTGGRAFATKAERDAALEKAAQELAASYPNSREGAMALYFLATDLAEKGDLNKALEMLDSAMKAGDADTRGLAGFARAEVLRGLDRKDEAETALRAVIAKPGGMVNANQATLALADLIAQSKPDEAIKLLEPLRTQEGSVQQLAARRISEIRTRQERASAN